MMKSLKRFLCLFLSLMMLAGCCSVSAGAVETEDVAISAELDGHIHTSACLSPEGLLQCGIELFQQERILICQLEEQQGHIHTDECICSGGEYICAQESVPSHIHIESCYGGQGELVCQQEEAVGHTHSAECVCPGGELICYLAETVGHFHGESCYKEILSEEDPEEKNLEEENAEEENPEEKNHEEEDSEKNNLKAPEAPSNALILPENFDEWMTVAFPDPNLRQAIIEQVYSDLDGDLSQSMPEEVVGMLARLEASNRGIRDITGIWYLSNQKAGAIVNLRHNLIEDISVLESYVNKKMMPLILDENPIHIFANNIAYDATPNLIGTPRGYTHKTPTYVGQIMDKTAVYVRNGNEKKVSIFTGLTHGNGSSLSIAEVDDQYFYFDPVAGHGIRVENPLKEDGSFELTINGDSGMIERIYDVYGLFKYLSGPALQRHNHNFGYTFEYETYSTLKAEDENTILAGFTFTKYNEDETKALSGAKYQLLDADGNPAQIVTGKNSDGTLRTASVGESYTDPDTGTVYQSILTTDENGEIKQEYLLPGSYTLTEVKAPEGYVLNGTPIPITVTAPKTAAFVIAGGEGDSLNRVLEDDATYTPTWNLPGLVGIMETLDESPKTAADYGAELFIKNGGNPVSLTDGYDSAEYEAISPAETIVKLGNHPGQLFGSVEAAETCVNSILSGKQMQALDDNITLTSSGGVYYLKGSAEEKHYQQSNEKVQLHPQEIRLKKYADIHHIWNFTIGTGLPDPATLYYFTITDENGDPAVGYYRLADSTEPAQAIPSNGEVAIKADQEIIFSGLSAGDYTIAERVPVDINYNRTDIYVQDERTWDTDYLYDTRTVTIAVGETDSPSYILAEFTNYYSVGGLYISKSVTGTTDEEDLKKHFTFTVTLDDTSINGVYGDMMCIETWEYTEIEFTDGVATFQLMDGEYANLFGIPSNVGYTVTETDNEGYTIVASDNTTGTIPDTDTVSITFENQKGSSSPSDFSLKITKDNVNGDKLSGAGFKLYTDEACTTLAGVFLDSGKTESIANALPEQLMTDTNGELRFYGLTEGSYFLKEFYTPSGYSLLNAPVPITIAADGTVTISGVNKTPPAGEKEIAVRVTNDALILPLPVTGLGGAAPFVGVGMTIMAASFMAMMISMKKRRRRA